MIHIYYAAGGSESAENLFKKIEELGTQARMHGRGGDFDKSPGDLCVNWGTSSARHFGGRARWLNKNVYVDKLAHMRRMADARVPVPEVVVGERPRTGKWYARLTQHMDGSDLERNLDRGDFYVRHVDIAEEYRVHVFRGEVLRASRKVLMPGFRATTFRCGDAWGFSNANYIDRVGQNLLRAAQRAVEAIEYDFGGVDVAETADGPVVFEVNSAPWLGGEMQRAYAKRIIRIAS